MAAVTLIFISTVLCCTPQSGTCLSNDNSQMTRLVDKILNQVEMDGADALKKDFDELELFVDSSSVPLTEGRNFLHSFITEINARYGLALTLESACKLVRENLDILQIPFETRDVLLKTIRVFESDSSCTKAQDEKPAQLHGFYWPTEWNWFGLNKKNKDNNSQDKFQTDIPHPAETELPGNCYIGGCELLAGALISILPLPGASYLGVAMWGMGPAG